MLGKRKEVAAPGNPLSAPEKQNRGETMTPSTSSAEMTTAGTGLFSNEAATVLSSDTTFKGSLSFEKTLRIEGKLEGDLSSAGMLLVGKGAEVRAEITVGSIHIEGNVTGNITAREKVELTSTAVVHGDVKAAKLVVLEGAVVVGRCEVSPGGVPARKEAGSSPGVAQAQPAEKREKVSPIFSNL